MNGVIELTDQQRFDRDKLNGFADKEKWFRDMTDKQKREFYVDVYFSSRSDKQDITQRQ